LKPSEDIRFGRPSHDFTRRDYTGLLALKNRFGHLAIQMTAVYGSWDDDFITELLDAEIEHDYEALDHILSSDRLAGKLGERIATQNQRFRRCIGIHSFAVRFVSLAL
jgi:hypothetical protein